MKFSRPLLLLVLLLGACTVAVRVRNGDFFFSFESSFDGWAAQGTDLQLGGGTIRWSITRSQLQARDGITSVEFFLENFNDAGKIWVEKAFALKPRGVYRVTVQYAFGPSHPGSTDVARLITGVFVQPPRTGADLAPAFQESTNAGSGSGTLRWVEKSYTFDAQADANGNLYVVVGIWGVWETPMTFYFDSVRVTIDE